MYWNLDHILESPRLESFDVPENFATRCLIPLIFQTMSYVWSNCLSLKNQRFKPLGCKNIRIGKSEFLSKTQLIYDSILVDISLGVARRFVNFYQRNNLFIEPIVADIVPGLKEIELRRRILNYPLPVNYQTVQIEKRSFFSTFFQVFRIFIVLC